MSDPTVPEYVEYCHTQAGLLAGRIETLQAEADRLLDEIEAETETVRTQLESAQTGDEDADPEAGVAAIEDKQASVRELQARISRCSDVAAGYTDLAERLSDGEDPSEALAEIVEFELDHEAYACFEDRTTLAEETAGLSGDGG